MPGAVIIFFAILGITIATGYGLGRKFGIRSYAIIGFLVVIVTVLLTQLLHVYFLFLSVPLGFIASISALVGHERHKHRSKIQEIVDFIESHGVDGSLFVRWVKADASRKHMSKEDLIKHYDPSTLPDWQ